MLQVRVLSLRPAKDGYSDTMDIRITVFDFAQTVENNYFLMLLQKTPLSWKSIQPSGESFVSKVSTLFMQHHSMQSG